MRSPFAPNEVPAPVCAAALTEKPVSRSVGSWNFQGAAPVKEKYRPRSTGEGFCRVNCRQNESGVLRGGKFFRGLFLTEVVGLTVITNHFLWLCSKMTRPHLVDEFEPIHKINGIYKKKPRHVECVKRVLKNLLKWSKKSMTHLVALGKNALCESEQTPVSVCGKSFYCQQQQDVVFLTIV